MGKPTIIFNKPRIFKDTPANVSWNSSSHPLPSLAQLFHSTDFRNSDGGTVPVQRVFFSVSQRNGSTLQWIILEVMMSFQYETTARCFEKAVSSPIEKGRPCCPGLEGIHQSARSASLRKRWLLFGLLCVPISKLFLFRGRTSRNHLPWLPHVDTCCHCFVFASTFLRHSSLLHIDVYIRIYI